MARSVRLGGVHVVALCAAIATACGFNHNVTGGFGDCPDVPAPTGPNVFGGATPEATVPPPPLSGGTLTAFPRSDGSTYVAASIPETDQIAIVHVAPDLHTSLDAIFLEQGAEPGRIVEDGAGRAHVLLRGRGAVQMFVPETATLGEARPVCPAPRGIVYDADLDALHVVCATGELVTLPAAGGPPIRSVHVDRDLRDVVVVRSRLLVTRFRSAEVLTLEKDGSIVQRASLPTAPGRQARVAWRMTEKQNHVVIAYELESDAPIDVRSTANFGSSYGAGNRTTDGGPLVIAALAVMSDDTSFQLSGSANEVPALRTAPLFDVGVGADGTFASSFAHGQNGDISLLIQTGQTVSNATIHARHVPAMTLSTVGKAPMLFVQTREPHTITLLTGRGSGNYAVVVTVPIPGVSDVGFDIFHTPTPVGLACASCHPEGGDDGHVWHFITQDAHASGAKCGPGVAAPANDRRTQSLRGGILATVPLHWDGDMAGMGDIISEVFSRRMGGGSVTPTQRFVVERWINSIPRLPARTDLDAARVGSGRALFEGKGGCATCHSGSMLTNNQTLDVGRGALQVPNLIGIGDRAPFLHDGCAKTLADRFDAACGGSHHGNPLGANEQSDVNQYLESL